jgi:hypothetical protein
MAAIVGYHGNSIYQAVASDTEMHSRYPETDLDNLWEVPMEGSHTPYPELIEHYATKTLTPPGLELIEALN